MKFKEFFQIGLACLLAATLSTSAFAAPEDTPLPGDYQATPAVRPSKSATTSTHKARHTPVTKKHRRTHGKRVSKHHSQYRAIKHPTGKHQAKKHKIRKHSGKHIIKKHKHKKQKSKHKA